MATDYDKLIGKQVDGVFPLRGIINSSYICENEDKVTDIVSMAFHTYSNLCDGASKNAPMFEFGITKNKEIIEEYFIRIYQDLKCIGIIFLKPYLYQNSNILYLELDEKKTAQFNSKEQLEKVIYETM